MPVPAAAAAPVSAELVLPAAPRAVPRATQILNAGTTGFLWAQEGDDRLLWTDYTTGTATALEQRLPAPVTYDIDYGYFPTAASFQPGWYGAGSDTVALYSAEPSPRVTLLQGASRGSTVLLPEGQSYWGTFGDTVLTRADDQAFHLLRAGTDTPVTGFPADATEITVENGDARSVIFCYKTGDPSDPWRHWGMLELATGAFTPLPDRPDPDNGWEVNGFRLGVDSVLRLRPGRSKLDVLDRDDLSAQPRTVETGFLSYEAAYGIIGSTLLAVEPVWPGNNLYRGQPLWAVPTDTTGRRTKVMDPAAHQIVPAPDGSVLVAGAERYVAQGDLDWAVYRIAQATDGSVERRRLTAVQPVPAQIHGLALGSGILSTADNSTVYEPSTILGAYRSTWLTTPAAGETPAVEKTTVDGLVSGRDGSCYSSTPRCIRMFADGTGHHGREEPTESGLTMLYANGASPWGPTLNTGDSYPHLVDLSGRYAVVDSAVPGRQYIGEFRYGASGEVLQRRDRVAAAVWGSTLWSGAATGGVVTATRLPAGDTVETFTTSNGCTPSGLQAVDRWVYWTCVDSWGWERGSGVYDRMTKRTAAAPAGQVLLGDGYLVEHVAGADGGLRLIDLRGELPTRMLVDADDLGRDGGARTTWTVDRFGGGVAYADNQQRVHIVSTGIPASALSVIDSTVSNTADNWSGTWWLSKPAAAWQITFQNSSGATIRTLAGSSARGVLQASWDGKDSAGRAVADGSFTWTLTALPADGVGAALTVAGPPIPAPPVVVPPVTDLTATGFYPGAKLSWKLPNITNLDRVIVRMATGTTPPSSITSGTGVYAGTGSSVTVSGLTAGTTYSFQVWVRDRSGKLSTGTTLRLRLLATKQTISSSATTINYGGSVRVTGRLSRKDTGAAIAGAQVQLYGRRKGSTNWVLLGTATSSSTGGLSFSHKPSWSLDYRWTYRGSPQFAGVVSSNRAVKVRVVVTAKLSKTSFARGGSVKLSGKVSPSHAGKTVYLQRYVGGKWTTVTSKKLSSTSSYSFTIKPSSRGTYKYRVYRPADTDHLSGVSSVRTFKVY